MSTILDESKDFIRQEAEHIAATALRLIRDQKLHQEGSFAEYLRAFAERIDEKAS